MSLKTFLCPHFLHIASIFPSLPHFPDSVVISSYAPLGPFRHVSFFPSFPPSFIASLFPSVIPFLVFYILIPSTLSPHFVLYLLPFVLSLCLSLYPPKPPSFPCCVLLYFLSFCSFSSFYPSFMYVTFLSFMHPFCFLLSLFSPLFTSSFPSFLVVSFHASSFMHS